MELRPWQLLPDEMRTKEVRKYYNILMKHRMWLEMKRVLDVIVAGIMLAVLIIPMGIIALAIRLDSPGPVFFRQERITQYGRKFRIFKFRTMVNDADKKGSLVTVGGDSRITRVGAVIRKYRLDEIPQLINVLCGDMSFVGTRPEVEKYVMAYTPAMMATLLMPAGITSEASIRYKDEDRLLEASDDVDYTYIHKVLPGKMRYNLKYLKKFSLTNDIRLCIETMLAVIH